MSQEPEELLIKRSLLNRHLCQQKIIEAAEENQQPTKYIGFDATTGMGKLQDVSGSITFGDSISNGAIAIGDTVRMRQDKYDSIPRTKKTTTQKSEAPKEEYGWLALAETKAVRYDAQVLQASNNYTMRLLVGFEAQNLSISFFGLAGAYIEINYPGGSYTTSVIPGVGIFTTETFSYSPDAGTDGYIEFISPTNQEVEFLLVYQIFYYLTDGKLIVKIPYQLSNQKVTLPQFISVISYSDDYAYITFKEINSIFSSYEKITVITIDKQFNVLSVDVFDYAGENTFTLENKDWRKSFTHSFLISPASDAVACINNLRFDSLTHVDIVKRFISSASLLPSDILNSATKLTFKRGNFNPSSTACNATYKPKTVIISNSTQVKQITQFCNLSSISIYAK